MKRTIDIKGILIGSAVLVTVIAVLIIVVIILNRKRKAEIAVLPQETDWGKTLTESESAIIERIAKGLYDEMKGLNWFSRNKAIYDEYNATSDRIFVGVANYFAQVYGNGENLAQWMKSEVYSWASIQTDGVAQAIINRLAQHGIK